MNLRERNGDILDAYLNKKIPAKELAKKYGLSYHHILIIIKKERKRKKLIESRIIGITLSECYFDISKFIIDSAIACVINDALSKNLDTEATKSVDHFFRYLEQFKFEDLFSMRGMTTSYAQFLQYAYKEWKEANNGNKV